jgi:hypothetical protein
MAFPPPTIRTDITDATEQGGGVHSGLHNTLGHAVNDITVEAQRIWQGVIQVDNRVTGTQGDVNALVTRVTTVEGEVVGIDNELTTLENQVASIAQKTARVGTVRGRTNIDSVIDGGSVRYTVDHGTYGVVDTGDGSGYTVPTGVYGVSASTVPDGGDDLTCYIVIGTTSVAVGSRLPGDGATYATWVGRVVAGEQIHVNVRMPVARAVVGGFLQIWRLAESL